MHVSNDFHQLFSTYTMFLVSVISMDFENFKNDIVCLKWESGDNLLCQL